MQDDLLRDIRDALDRALAEGSTIAQFRDGLEPVLRAKGWWGKSTLTDPLTGETREVQLGSARRLRVILDTNMRTAYAAGRWGPHPAHSGRTALSAVYSAATCQCARGARTLPRAGGPRRSPVVGHALPAQRLFLRLPDPAAVRSSRQKARADRDHRSTCGYGALDRQAQRTNRECARRYRPRLRKQPRRGLSRRPGTP